MLRTKLCLRWERRLTTGEASIGWFDLHRWPSGLLSSCTLVCVRFGSSSSKMLSSSRDSSALGQLWFLSRRCIGLAIVSGVEEKFRSRQLRAETDTHVSGAERVAVDHFGLEGYESHWLHWEETRIFLVPNDLEDVLQSDAEFSGLVYCWRDAKEISTPEGVRMFDGIGDADRRWGSKF